MEEVWRVCREPGGSLGQEEQLKNWGDYDLGGGDSERTNPAQPAASSLSLLHPQDVAQASRLLNPATQGRGLQRDSQ